MADDRSSDRATWIQVTVRFKVPAGISGAEVFRFVERENLEFRPHIEFDRDYSPVPVRPQSAERELLESGRQLVVVRAWVDPQHIAALREAPYVDHVGRDARLEPFAMVQGGVHAAPSRVDCGATAKADGTAKDVARDLGITKIRAAGFTGRGIVVGVVDGGITAYGRPTQVGTWSTIPQAPAVGEVIAGWPPTDWGTTAEGWGQHGNMIAFDVQAMAPEAELWDIRIWEPRATFGAYVSNAVAGYGLAIDHYKAYGVPQILVNSWGLYDSDNGPEYAFDPKSDMALAVEAALNAGILILFAAGNCGDGCPFASGTLCGFGNRGPGASILGPNGHRGVMTVGAATLRGEWCGYTSQGPAVLPPNDPDKPDFCSISQFKGFFPNESGLRPYDGGTSAATGIAAGVVALLKQARPDLTQEECKRLLKETARPIKTPAAYGGAGAGIIDALRAFRSL
jgi:serine protease AprX